MTADGNFHTIIDKTFSQDEYGTYLMTFHTNLSISSGEAIQQNLSISAHRSSSETTTAIKASNLAADSRYVLYGSIPMLIDINSNCNYIRCRARTLPNGSSRAVNVTDIRLDFMKLR